MDININLKEKKKDDVLKFLRLLQKEIEKLRDEEITVIDNAGHFIIVGTCDKTIFIPTYIYNKKTMKKNIALIS